MLKHLNIREGRLLLKFKKLTTKPKEKQVFRPHVTRLQKFYVILRIIKFKKKAIFMHTCVENSKIRKFASAFVYTRDSRESRIKIYNVSCEVCDTLL